MTYPGKMCVTYSPGKVCVTYPGKVCWVFLGFCGVLQTSALNGVVETVGWPDPPKTNLRVGGLRSYGQPSASWEHVLTGKARQNSMFQMAKFDVSAIREEEFRGQSS